MNKSNASARWMSASNMPISAPNLLLVDDDRIIRMVLREALSHHGYNVHLVATAEEALKVLNEDGLHVDAMLLDRGLPGMSGLELAAHMRQDQTLCSIPIIMLTGSGEQEEIQQGIDAGVFYYLVKPVDNNLLRSVIDSVLRNNRHKKALVSELNRHSAALKAMKHCQVAVRTLTEAEDTACLLASCFPDPERVVTGLMELLVNSVEHGNLNITYEEKHRLLAAGNWREEVDRLAMLPENLKKEVEVIYQNKDEGHLVQITDMGMGFDWKRYWHINPARATADHGRGIARTRLMVFDRMAYNDKGNRVTVMVNKIGEPQKNYAW